MSFTVARPLPASTGIPFPSFCQKQVELARLHGTLVFLKKLPHPRALFPAVRGHFTPGARPFPSSEVRHRHPHRSSHPPRRGRCDVYRAHPDEVGGSQKDQAEGFLNYLLFVCFRSRTFDVSLAIWLRTAVVFKTESPRRFSLLAGVLRLLENETQVAVTLDGHERGYKVGSVDQVFRFRVVGCVCVECCSRKLCGVLYFVVLPEDLIQCF